MKDDGVHDNDVDGGVNDDDDNDCDVHDVGNDDDDDDDLHLGLLPVL